MPADKRLLTSAAELDSPESYINVKKAAYQGMKTWSREARQRIVQRRFYVREVLIGTVILGLCFGMVGGCISSASAVICEPQMLEAWVAAEGYDNVEEMIIAGGEDSSCFSRALGF